MEGFNIVNEIKVSVIIPVYNTEKYLRKCLDSVLAQTLKEIEIICIDDGSTDNSLAILKEYQKIDSRILVFTQNNLFAGVARNQGIKVASGKYLFFMDSDDFCDKYLLEKAVYKAESDEADIVVFNYCRYNNETGEKENRDGLVKSRLPLNKKIFSYKDIPNKICNIVNPTPWNKLFLREMIVKNNLKYLNTSTTNDITFATMAVIVANKIVYLDKTLLFYRVNHLKSITSLKKNRLDNIIKAVLEVDEQAHRLEYYYLIKKSIRIFVIQNLFVGLERYAGDNDTFQYIDYQKKIESIFYSYPLFIGITQADLESVSLFDRYIELKNNAKERNDLRFLPKVIVSFTTYSKRIHTVHKVIATILKQTVQPDKVILWLSKENFPSGEKVFNEKLIDYSKKYIDIEWVDDDLKSHKKYYYALKKYPNAIIITIDDDLIYEKHMIEKLIQSYLMHPSAISAMRTHLIVQDDKGEIAPYSEWKKEYNGLINIPSMQLFATTGAGTLFPPHCFNKEVYNLEIIKKYCLNADDIWIKFMGILYNVPVVLVSKNEKLVYIKNTQDIALYKNNIYRGENDKQLKNLLNYYQNILNLNDIKNIIFPCEKYIIDTKLYNTAIVDTVIKTNDVEKKNYFYYFIEKIKGGICCYKEHGFKYTLRKVKEKFKDEL